MSLFNVKGGFLGEFELFIGIVYDRVPFPMFRAPALDAIHLCLDPFMQRLWFGVSSLVFFPHQTTITFHNANLWMTSNSTW